MPLAIVDLRRFDALKCEFVCREWYYMFGTTEPLHSFAINPDAIIRNNETRIENLSPPKKASAVSHKFLPLGPASKPPGLAIVKAVVLN